MPWVLIWWQTGSQVLDGAIGRTAAGLLDKGVRTTARRR